MLDKYKPITILCPEGFSYISWQRVVCMQDNVNLTEEVYTQAMRFYEADEKPEEYNEQRWFYADGSLFLLSGESLGLEDVAEMIGEMLGIDKIIPIDGDEPDPSDYPNVNRILAILGKNGPSGNYNEKPYDFPMECKSYILDKVEAEMAQYKTDDELQLFLYGADGNGRPKGAAYSIVDHFANWVFDSGEWKTWDKYKC